MAREPRDNDGVTRGESLGARLRALRARAGLSQTELATAAGVSGSYVSLVEAGQRVPREATLDRLSRALRVTRGELLGSAPADPLIIEMELAQAQSDMDRGAARSALRTLDSLLRRHADSIGGDTARRIRLARGEAHCLAGDAGRGIAELEPLLSEGVPPALRGRLLSALSGCYLKAGDLARAIDLAERGREQITDTEAEAAQRAEYVALGITLACAYRQRGDLASAQIVSRQAAEAAERAGTPAARGEAYRAASVSAEAAGDMGRALSLAVRAIGAFSEVEAHLQLARARVVYARILLSVAPGRGSEAMALLAEAAPVLRGSGTARDAAQCQLQLARAHLSAGHEDQAIALASDVAATAPPVEGARGHLLIARARLAAGPGDRAVRDLEAGRRRLSAAGSSVAAARAWRELGDLFAQADRPQDAIGAYDRALAMMNIPPLTDSTGMP